MLHYLRARPRARPVAARIIQHVSRRSCLDAPGAASCAAPPSRSPPSRRRPGAFEAYQTGGAGHAERRRHRPAGLRRRSTRTARSRSSRTAPRWAPARAPACRWCIADEMEADWARVKIVQAPGDEPSYGNQDTDGSRSMRHHIQPMRQMGAAVRTMLDARRRRTLGGRARRRSGRRGARGRVAGAASELGYGELAEAAMALPVPAVRGAPRSRTRPSSATSARATCRSSTCTTSPPARRSTAPTSALPGMKYAAVARPPVVGGKVKSFDATAALKVPGSSGWSSSQGAPPAEVRAARRRRRRRRPTPGRRSQGARRAEDRVGRRPARRLRHRGLSARRWRRPPRRRAR